MRQVSPQAQSLPLYVHDGFDLDRFSKYIAGRTDFVVHDYHSYFVFTPQDNAKPAHVHTVDIATNTSDSLAQASAQERRNLIVGEWSCALTPDSLKKEGDEDDARKQFCTGQMEVYTNDTAGWAFWCKLTYRACVLVAAHERVLSICVGVSRPGMVLQDCGRKKSPIDVLLVRSKWHAH